MSRRTLSRREMLGATMAAPLLFAPLSTVTIFPLIMLACYLLLIFYFRSKGGYQAVHIGEETSGD